METQNFWITCLTEKKVKAIIIFFFQFNFRKLWKVVCYTNTDVHNSRIQSCVKEVSEKITKIPTSKYGQAINIIRKDYTYNCQINIVKIPNL